MMITGKRARQFESNKRAHAVAKQRKRLIEQRNNIWNKSIHQREDVGKGGLLDAHFAPGKLYGAYFHISRQHIRPRPVGRRAATCIRETKQAQRSAWIRTQLRNPGIQSRHKLSLLVMCLKTIW